MQKKTDISRPDPICSITGEGDADGTALPFMSYHAAGDRAAFGRDRLQCGEPGQKTFSSENRAGSGMEEALQADMERA